MNKQVSAILCSDLHLREDTPKCRTDDYKAAQLKKIEWLNHLAATHCCPILCAGDIFDKWNISAEMSAWAIENVPQMYAIPGQHDLPDHNLELIKKSGFNVLKVANIIDPYNNSFHTLYKDIPINFIMFPFGEALEGYKLPIGFGWRSIALIHTLVLGPKDAKMKGSTVQEIFDKMPKFDLIICGDNHKSFVVRNNNYADGCLFVSPGSMMRMTADQIDYKPRVYLWYADTNTVEPAYYPIESGVVTREHIDKKQEKEMILEAFVQSTQGGEVTASFEKNMEKYLQQNKVSANVESKIYKAMR